MNTEKVKVSVQSEGVNKDLTADFVCVIAFSNDDDGAEMCNLMRGGSYPGVVVNGIMRSLAEFIDEISTDVDMEELLLTLVGEKVVGMMENFDKRYPERRSVQDDRDKLDISLKAISAEDAAELLKKVIDKIREEN